MPIFIVCPSCVIKIKAPDCLAGRMAKCPKCGQPISVPGKDSVPAEPQQPSGPATLLACPHCNGQVAFESGLAGQIVTCPHCHDLIDMPAALPPAPPQDEWAGAQESPPLSVPDDVGRKDKQHSCVEVADMTRQELYNAVHSAVKDAMKGTPQVSVWTICGGIWLFFLTSLLLLVGLGVVLALIGAAMFRHELRQREQRYSMADPAIERLEVLRGLAQAVTIATAADARCPVSAAALQANVGIIGKPAGVHGRFLNGPPAP